MAGEDIKRRAKGFFGHGKRPREASVVIDIDEAYRAALTSESCGDIYRGRSFSYATFLISEGDEPSERQSSHIRNL
jgi:hypothetical protein